jgi:predicted nucleic acid-binding protein
MANVLIDTDIVIEIMRSNQSVIEDVKNLWQRGNMLFCSPVTVAEVYHGLRPEEVNNAEQFFRTIRCLPVTKEVGEKAGEYLSKYHKSNGVELGDALIAAVCFLNKTSLYTLNKKHYPMGDIKLL